MDTVLTPTDFVAVLNQTLEFAYPNVVVQGELANLRVSKNRWVYFDLKDDDSSVKFFGTVYSLPGPLEDGMLLQVRGAPRLHQLYGFSVNVMTIQPVGEGSIKKAAALLEAKLTAEGLFDESRKRLIPFAPQRIGLIASSESAAYHDFIKIIDQRWAGVKTLLHNVQVQGEPAVMDIVQAIEYMNQLPDPPEVLVITRGGGSADDLAAFSTEQVVRAVAASRIPTLVAIGHEVDISLAELAADKRASTPSNAAELLVPDKKEVLSNLKHQTSVMREFLSSSLKEVRSLLADQTRQMQDAITNSFFLAEQTLLRQSDLLAVLNPEAALKRGYAVIRNHQDIIRSVTKLKKGDNVSIQFHDGRAGATINKVQ